MNSLLNTGEQINLYMQMLLTICVHPLPWFLFLQSAVTSSLNSFIILSLPGNNFDSERWIYGLKWNLKILNLVYFQLFFFQDEACPSETEISFEIFGKDWINFQECVWNFWNLYRMSLISGIGDSFSFIYRTDVLSSFAFTSWVG